MRATESYTGRINRKFSKKATDYPCGGRADTCGSGVEKRVLCKCIYQ